MRRRTIDKPFLITTIILVLAGFFIFTSASLGLLARGDVEFSAVAFNQLLGLVIGLGLMFLTMRVSFRLWNRFAFYFFLATIATTLLVFVPGLGFAHGGAQPPL